jgi:flagellum-specific peptidoglycan hydrolase FlgJ
MGYTSAQAKSFIEHIAPLIQREGFSRGYTIVSTTIAQSIVEGACGTSGLAKNYHNHFGMKAGKSWRGKSVNMKTKEEYTPGQLTDIRDFFRAYDSDMEGIEGYYDFIDTKRYANLRDAKTYRQFAEYLKADGWATSSSYVNTLCNTVEKYKLTKYDEQNIHLSYFPMYVGKTDSIVMALDSLGVDSSKDNRRAIYNANFTDAYTGSAKQNTAMLVLLKQGILIKP